MNIIDKIITESINSVINENKYKSGASKMRAASHAAARKEGGESASERYKNWLAKQEAIRDINQDLRSQRVNPYHKSYAKQWDIENGGYNPDYDRSMELQRYMDADDEFRSRISNNTFKDAENWLMNRDNIDELY
jgi:hypothetical protein